MTQVQELQHRMGSRMAGESLTNPEVDDAGVDGGLNQLEGDAHQAQR